MSEELNGEAEINEVTRHQQDAAPADAQQEAANPTAFTEKVPRAGKGNLDLPQEKQSLEQQEADQPRNQKAADERAEEEQAEGTKHEADDSREVLHEQAACLNAVDQSVLQESRRRTRRSFVLSGAAAAAGVGFYKWLDVAPQDGMQPGLLRQAYLANAALSREVGGDRTLASTYPLHRAETLRVNGVFGIKRPILMESWRLQLVGVRDDKRSPRYVKDVTEWEYRYGGADAGEDQGHDTKTTDPKNGSMSDSAIHSAEKMAPEQGASQAIEDENRSGRKPRGMEEAGESDSTLAPGTPGLLLTMDDVCEFPKHELVTQFKCIEGWSQIVQWAGIRLADLLEAYPPALIDGKEPKYVYMETPDGDYYTGYDLSVCRHPQTLLVTEMMGVPLTQPHGAPLRLHMPTKYGYKQIKRIGLISYTNDKPDDYWTKLGYDWYAGL